MFGIFRTNVLSPVAVLLVAIFIICAGATPTTQARRAIPKLPNLSGTWRLNEALSATWSKTIFSDVGDLRITPPATLSAGTSTVIAPAATTDARVGQLLQAITTLEIFQRRRELVMNATGARSMVLSRTFMMDEKSDGNEGVGSRNPLRTRANWVDKSFIIETTTQQGSRLKEIYEVSGERLYLCVTIQSDLEVRPTFVLRVYEKATTRP